MYWRKRALTLSCIAVVVLGNSCLLHYLCIDWLWQLKAVAVLVVVTLAGAPAGQTITTKAGSLANRQVERAHV